MFRSFKHQLKVGFICNNLFTFFLIRNVHFTGTVKRSQRKSSFEISVDENMSVLNVAEKNDVAKHLAGYLSNGTSQRREGYSKFNKIYEFSCPVRGQTRKMVMTSVSGHLLNLEFVGNYKKWNMCLPAELFDAPVQKYCPQDYEPIKRTLEREVRSCNTLIIWTDCDREGENIGFEIISVCRAVKPNIQVFRAKFSEITAVSARRALDNLTQPNELINQAVNVRSELDLRIGAAFTRFQTLRLQRVFPDVLAHNVISYGSCQFPTLGFVVERYKAIERFIPEQFWKIKVTHDVDDVKVDFSWARVRLFDEEVVRAIYERCLENPIAKVESVISKPKSKWRPLPLDTVEFEKLASRKLRLNVKDAMATAEKLYTKGLISYPRTETNIFPKELNLTNLVQMQTENRHWGAFAQRVLHDGPHPRQGRKSDQAHPPIHPTKAAHELQGTEAKVYEFVVRHFLACVSKDAQGHETIVNIDVNGEKFVGCGLMIVARNYLDVYPYETWSDRAMHLYTQGQTFRPTSLEMVDGETSPPRLLTEADLIALMEKHGIGTDATHAEHIDKIKTRAYVGLENNMYFVPGHLGIGLVDGYDDMGFQMSKPHLRAELEADLVRISNGQKDAQVVLAEQIAKYREVFRLATEQAEKIDTALAQYFNTRPQAVPVNEPPPVSPAVTKCRRCQCNVVVKQRPNNAGWYLGCLGFPQCRTSLWFPAFVTRVELADSTCPTCGPEVRQLKISFQPGSVPPFYSNPYVGCVNGCDRNVLEMMDVQSLASVNQDRPSNQGNQDDTRSSSGYSSINTASRASSVNPSVPSATRSNDQFSSSSLRGVTNPRNQFHNSFLDNNSDDENQQRPGNTNTWNNQGTNNRPSFGTNFNNSFNTGPGWTMNDRNNQGTTNNRPSWGGNNSFNPESTDDVCCTCGLPARKLKVMKESVNKGRFFYACSKPMDEKCDFFQWADDGPVGGGGGGGGDGWGGGGGGGGGGWGGRGDGGGWSGRGSGRGSGGSRGGKRGSSGGRGKPRGKSNTQFRAKPYESDQDLRKGARKDGGTSGKRLCSMCKEPGKELFKNQSIKNVRSCYGHLPSLEEKDKFHEVSGSGI